jgi:hypothetical protein
MILGGESELYAGNPGSYGKVQSTFLDVYKSNRSAAQHFETGSVDGSISPVRMLWAAPCLVHSGEIATKMGVYEGCIGTCQEYLPREGTPDDTIDKLNLDLIETQVDEFAAMLVPVLNHPGISLRRSVVPNKQYFVSEFTADNKILGPMAMGKGRGSSIANKPMSDTTLMLWFTPRHHWFWMDPPKKFYSFDNFQVLRTNKNGSYSFGPVQAGWFCAFTTKTDERGVITSVATSESSLQGQNRVNMFECKYGNAVFPPRLPVLFTTPVAVLNAVANSHIDYTKNYYTTLDNTISWFSEEKIKRIKLFNADFMINFGSPDDSLAVEKTKDVSGQGFVMDGTYPDITKTSALDLWRLDESRVQILRSRGVMNSSIDEIHGRVKDLLLTAAKTTSYVEQQSLYGAAFLMENTVYKQTRSTFDDLVRAVLMLLGLAVPFAFALERLLIGSPLIYKQIMWFVIFFAATFLIIFFSHPAFAVSNTPVIIFLGFVVVVLSALVIYIIMKKFEVELKAMQGVTATIHTTDISRIGTLMVAMRMGISTMRRRPLRTALTTTTITLLTFTILYFASFGTRTGIVKLFDSPAPKYTGVLIHQVNWTELNRDITDILKNRWGDNVIITTRWWISAEQGKTTAPLATRRDGTKPVNLKGVLGLEYAELNQRADLAEMLGIKSVAEYNNKVWVTKSVAEMLNVSPGDEILVGGIPLKVGKLLDANNISVMEDMDGSKIIPVDFDTMKGMAQQQTGTMTEDRSQGLQNQGNWATLPVDSVVIVPVSVAQNMKATLRAITLYTQNTGTAIDIGEELARIMNIPISATRNDGVYFHTLGPIVQANGAKDLFFPILLGGLVIFGTMLGSVADREREIYTFSSLGLAPPHIASLFFAEALVYSVIGGLGGYLIAQMSMKLLTFMANLGLIHALEINYSSTNAVTTLIIVMVTVLISAIYPAMKASRSANPGVLSSWKPPVPEGDVFNIVFPFTVSGYDMTGIVSFLKEHFDNFTDVGLGVFMAQGTRLVKEEKDLGLDVHMALAPFDLGVTQFFEMRSRASEIPNINEIVIRIIRRSGEPKDWKRLNKILLGDLRRQFLIWRSIPQDLMDMYRHRTLVEIENQKENA